ncbi:hypothetical protein [Metallosphaera hakonensis]|nr:hypothetical protein [Metallosphaera hakonensis]
MAMRGRRKSLVEVTLNVDTEHVSKVRKAMQETEVREAVIVSLEGETRI